MKYNKIALVWSSVITAAFFVGYCVFGYCDALRCLFLKDISLALIGSGVFLIVTSVVGYFVEKQKSKLQIIKAFCDIDLSSRIISVSDFNNNSNEVSYNALLQVLISELDRLCVLAIEIRTYNEGLLFNKTEWKPLLNESIQDYMLNLYKLKEYISHSANCNEEVVSQRVQQLTEQESQVAMKINTWLDENKMNNNKKFTLGKNFVPEYETMDE